MDREKIRSFTSIAETNIASVRSNILITAQTGDAADLATGRRELVRLHQEALSIDFYDVATSIADVICSLDRLSSDPKAARTSALAVLDSITRAEASLWKAPRGGGDLLDDVSGFVDASFSQIAPVAQPVGEVAEIGFEVDDETFDIFRSEAEELLENISRGIETLRNEPCDQQALWEVRRNFHTLKGAAGIVGLTAAAEIAHRMEDLLDRMVEQGLQIVPAVTELFQVSISYLSTLASGGSLDQTLSLEAHHTAAVASLLQASSAQAKVRSESGHITPAKPAAVSASPVPIVRVSLERLDELVGVSAGLLRSLDGLEDQMNALPETHYAESLRSLAHSFEKHRSLTDELHAKLLRIRMIRFGTLETRLTRTVNMTCSDERKKARIQIENPDTEVDTQIVDGMIEPLLHLLKNAVVHGIESPETRRMIGKSEFGTITVQINADNGVVHLSVADDGAGISVPKLKEKAVEQGLLARRDADELSDREALDLIFERGLTTAEKLDLNAGRGVGMSIVKESVENRGGTVSVESHSQLGTKFTIRMPLNTLNLRRDPSRTRVVEPASAGPPLVLVIDDSASIRRQAARIVENAGFKVITANNGADALELLLNGSFEPALILSDVEMPQIDGWELLEYIKTDENLGGIPVVLITSLDSDSHREKARQLGASDYVVKPLTQEALDTILRSLKVGVADQHLGVSPITT